ncbi:MAG: bifunctional UDP-N-acetylglucosamine diphosphorylase/glucosamine-1-phosphate N-acetyltransferase GlmU, partial [Candidatus Aminicenantes bacterium]|nr:bifunctional UDP-N-acetylglucosamine diphosphorylase/glucosamine-1-phosphate N-acetyltransferase GlmU [Candidatus Aminicenantes bacterium]
TMGNPYGFGRVVEVAPGKYKVIEEREASPEEKRIKLANVGIYLGRIRDLLEALPQVSNDNSKKEYYLTDLIEILSCQDKKVQPFILPESEEIVGVNDRFELAQAIRVLQRRRNREFCEKGVTLLDPDSIWIEMEVEIEPDTVIWPEVILAGRTRIGRECEIESFCLIRDSKLKNKVHVFPSSVIEGSCLDDETHVGPFTHLRPGTHLRRGSRVGNFVEMKKTDFGPGSKALHLSYLGDSKVGQRVNIGAGTITCNYDGLKKYETVIEDEVFVGSGTQLVAPVKVGRGAYIGAGSTITKNVSPEALAVARSRQIEKKGWARRKKRKKE